MAMRRVKVENALGQNLRRIRKANGWSLRDAVQAIGTECSNAYLCQLERGYVKSPSVMMALAISRAYGLSLDQIAEWIAAPKEERPTCPHCGQELEDQ